MPPTTAQWKNRFRSIDASARLKRQQRALAFAEVAEARRAIRSSHSAATLAAEVKELRRLVYALAAEVKALRKCKPRRS